jgi:hypothetical protein
MLTKTERQTFKNEIAADVFAVILDELGMLLGELYRQYHTDTPASKLDLRDYVIDTLTSFEANLTGRVQDLKDGSDAAHSS